MVPLTGERTPALLVQDAVNGHVSPDGRWLAFEGIVAGRRDVFAQPFPGAGARHQISVHGGTQPRWSRDGRQLYYVSPSLDRTFVVDIAGGPSFSASQQRVLHQGTIRLAPNANTAYDVGADGRMLRIQQSRPQSIPSRIEVVLNWFDTLARSGATAK
jgi:hypothetical protein